MKQAIEAASKQALQAIAKLQEPEAIRFIEEVTYGITDAFNRGNKILIAGNGGSLCDAMHCAEELTGFYRNQRKALPAIALADPGHLTCVGNDVGFDQVFSRSVEALGFPGDVLIVLTTSGQSMNLIQAVETAKKRGLFTVAFLGKTGGKMKGLADLEWIVDGFSTSDRIQEVHMAAIHILIEMIEKVLFSPQQDESIEVACRYSGL